MHPSLTPRRRAGITLIDLMVTMAILGVLMAVLTGGIMRAMDRADVSLTRIIIGQTEGGVVMYRAENRRLPENLQDAADYMPDGRLSPDAWDNDLLYDRPARSGAGDHEIRSLGRDGAEGGEGFDADLSSLSLDDD
jgi:general secretion pathway protein G